LITKALKNVVVVAMANKLTRIAWAVLSSGNEYRSATTYRARKDDCGLEGWSTPTFPLHDDD
jgi:hypothetical protein